jgi:PAS domain S-box-containing protein
MYVSPGYETIWGRTCASLYEHPTSWMDAVHPEDRDRVGRAAVEKQALGEYNEEYRIVSGDGSIRWIRDRAFPVRDEHGDIYRIVGVAADITDYKRVEQAMQQANRELADLNVTLEERVKERTTELEGMIGQVNNEREKTERIINEIADGVIVLDVTGSVRVINPAARTLLGNTRQAGDPDLPDVALIPHLLELFQDPAEAVAKEVEVYDPRLASRRVLKATAVPMRDQQGALFGKVAVFHDITSRRWID